MATVEIYAFRHGETDWNVERRFQGHTDIPLNERGRTQARELGEALGDLGLEVILSSDLKRAAETSRIINARLKIPLIETEALREAAFGEPEGMLRDDIIARFGAAHWARWISNKKEDLDFAYPGGETKAAVLGRARGFIENFAENNPQRKIAVATHGAVLRMWVSSVAAVETPEHVSIPNGVIYRLDYDLTDQRWSQR